MQAGARVMPDLRAQSLGAGNVPGADAAARALCPHVLDVQRHVGHGLRGDIAERMPPRRGEEVLIGLVVIDTRWCKAGSEGNTHGTVKMPKSMQYNRSRGRRGRRLWSRCACSRS